MNFAWTLQPGWKFQCALNNGSICLFALSDSTTSAMSRRIAFTILAVILLAGHAVSAPGGGKPGSRSRLRDKAGTRIRKPEAVAAPTKGGTKGGAGGKGSTPAVVQRQPQQQTTDKNRRSNLPLDISPYHYTVSIVPDLDNSTFSGEVGWLILPFRINGTDT